MFELQNSCPDANKEGLLNSLGDEISLLTQVKQQVEEAIARSVSEGLSATFASASSTAPSRQATSPSLSNSGPYLTNSNLTGPSLVDPLQRQGQRQRQGQLSSMDHMQGQGQGQLSSMDHMQGQGQGQGQGQLSSMDHMQGQRQGQGQLSSMDHMQGQWQGQGQGLSSRVSGYWNFTDQRAISSRSSAHFCDDFSSDGAVTEIEKDVDDPLRGD